MSKRVIKRIIIAVSLIAIIALAYGYYESQKEFIGVLFYELFIRDSEPRPDPYMFNDYPDNKTGFYQFDPKIIFTSLDQGKTDVFITPLVENPNDVDVEYDGIEWTQFDFLRVASALSQKVWNEPLNLDNWDIYVVSFDGDCNDHFDGFNFFRIIYYKTIKTGWETVYTARTIQLIPWMGVAEWAGDGDFSANFFWGWRKIELAKFKTTAEQAVRIADENGGKAVRLNGNNKCNIYVSIRENPNRFYESEWYVDYDIGAFSAFINPFTRDVH